jgi:hypothetical protein
MEVLLFFWSLPLPEPLEEEDEPRTKGIFFWEKKPFLIVTIGFRCSNFLALGEASFLPSTGISMPMLALYSYKKTRQTNQDPGSGGVFGVLLVVDAKCSYHW